MKIEWKSCFRVGISVFIFYVLIAYVEVFASVLAKVFGAFVPLIVGFVIAYVINIPMSFYENKVFFKLKNKKIIRPLALVCAILTLVAIVSLIVGLVVPQLVSCIKLIIQMLPTAAKNVANYIQTLSIVPDSVAQDVGNVDVQSIFTEYGKIITSGFGNVVDKLFKAATSVVSGTVTVFLSIVFAVYLLIGKESLMLKADKLFRYLMSEKAEKKMYYVLKVLNESFRKYVVGQCIEAVILGVLCTLGMLVLRIPYAAMIGALVAFTALIPVAGAYIGAIVGAFIIFMVSPIKALIFIVFIVILQQIEGNIIYPKVVGNSIGLPGIWVLAAVVVGGGILGIPGMLLGVPLTATVYRILKDNINKGQV